MKIDKKLFEWRKECKDFYLFKLGFIAENKRKEMEEWISKNCSSEYSILNTYLIKNYYAFLDETDAIAFKLRWL